MWSTLTRPKRQKKIWNIFLWLFSVRLASLPSNWLKKNGGLSELLCSFHCLIQFSWLVSRVTSSHCRLSTGTTIDLSSSPDIMHFGKYFDISHGRKQTPLLLSGHSRSLLEMWNLQSGPHGIDATPSISHGCTPCVLSRRCCSDFEWQTRDRTAAWIEFNHVRLRTLFVQINCRRIMIFVMDTPDTATVECHRQLKFEKRQNHVIYH